MTPGDARTRRPTRQRRHRRNEQPAATSEQQSDDERTDEIATETTTLHLPTLHCEGCMSTARKELERAGATVEASDMDAKRVTVKFDSEQLSRRDLEAAMEAVGFPPEEEARDGDGSA